MAVDVEGRMRAELGSWAVRGAGLASGLAIVYGVVQLGVAAAGVLVLLFLAVLLASALEPVVDGLRTRLPLGRAWSVLLVYAAFVLLVVGFALFVVPAAAAQADEVLRSLPAFFAETRAWAADLRPAFLARSVETVIQSATRLAGPAAQPDADVILEVGGTAAEIAIHVATLLSLVFFWIVEHARLQRYALAFLPAERRTGARDAWNEIESRLGGWVRGQLILMGVIGIVTGTAYTLLGLPGALLLGVIAGIAEAIPMVGPLLGAIPAILVAATVSPELAVVVAIVYAVVQLVEGYVLVPVVMRNTVGLSPFLVLASLLFGGAVAGIAGAFLAVPVVAAVEIVASRFQAREVPVLQDVSAIADVDQQAAEAS
jgi:predicted PurR-regulated permease PerM